MSKNKTSIKVITKLIKTTRYAILYLQEGK